MLWIPLTKAALAGSRRPSDALATVLQAIEILGGRSRIKRGV